eukprot:GFYU01008045.1.p1 GENE.GFYU01008045.1~~GFYU01008045.1.p1  ORF type:complete len:710 (+),score=87.35 GFYU01008045.1:106-2130(+)
MAQPQPSTSAFPCAVQYAPYESAVEVTFWHELAKRKLEVYMLEDTVVDVHGTFQITSSSQSVETVRPSIVLGHQAFDAATPPNELSTADTLGSLKAPVTGRLWNFNTVEEFKKVDKTALAQEQAQQLLAACQHSDARNLVLNKFFLITFSDLKKHHFYYWFDFPALQVAATQQAPPRSIGDVMNVSQQQQVCAYYDKNTTYPATVCHIDSEGNIQFQPVHDVPQSDMSNSNLTVLVPDGCTLPENPGWPVRNVLACLRLRLRVTKCTVVCVRFKGRENIQSSLVLDVTLDGDVTAEPVGWERNNRGKMGPRMIDLSAHMAPEKLAQNAADMNLKLMRWRLLPSLDTNILGETRCLLLGAGTLGCAVSRNLLAWGVRHMTFVDSGNVSYSNPVRQTLFEFEDCKSGGKVKALAAAENLNRVFPGLNATGVKLSIPMPGHHSSPEQLQQAEADTKVLSDLIDAHDIVFLLTDTRESRWLPSMLCAHKNKLLLNAALGLDTYLVMRQGSRPGVEAGESPHLGCYFCNDVVAPQDSMSNRTLDQQCTVTRPGVSALASAFLVELMVSLMHHPEGRLAPSETDNTVTKAVPRPLGIIPHQLRGFLSHFNSVVVTSPAFDKCTACSTKVMDAYTNSGFKFLAQVFSNPNYLEDITGLSQLQQEACDVDVEWDDDDGEEFC